MADIFHKSICKTKMIFFRGDPQPQLVWTRMGPTEVRNPYCFGFGDFNVYLFDLVCQFPLDVGGGVCGLCLLIRPCLAWSSNFGFKMKYFLGGCISFFCFGRINKIALFTSFCTAVLIFHIKGSLRQCVCFRGSNMACYGSRVTNGVSLNVCNLFSVHF